MKIGNKEFPDDCPKCGEVKFWIRKPNYRIVPEPFGKSYSCFSMICLKCKYETPVFKIREDYLRDKETEIEDVTPYKPSVFSKLMSKIFKHK
jgi:C4-type Zn-finger protein